MGRAVPGNPLDYWGPDPNSPLNMNAFNQLALGPMYVPREAPSVGAGAGSPFDVPAPSGGRSMPGDNYRKPLSEYAPTLYRQANPGEVTEYIPGMTTRDKTTDAPYFADHPDMATGQGGNAGGVMMAFDPSGIHGQINTSKPTFEPAWRSGYGEYRASGNDQQAYQDALIALRIPTDLRMSGVEKRQMQTAVERLKAAGWVSNEGRGYIEYLKP